MIIEIDKRAGFCKGVMRAIGKSEQAASGNNEVYSLGPLVHNEKEIQRLEKQGIRVISHDELDDIREGSVIIRAHGEPPETYRQAKERGLEVIDATCPVVLKVQKKIRNAAEHVRENGGHLFIYGKQGHAEVTGLLGQAQGKGVVLTGTGDIPHIQPGVPVYLFSQTTMSGEGYDDMAAEIRTRLADGQEFVMHRTICGQVYGRSPWLREFAARHDVVLFMSGKESSNGKYLFGVCKSVNPNTHFISWPGDIRESWLEGAQSVGISGAASTPYADLEELAERIKTIV